MSNSIIDSFTHIQNIDELIDFNNKINDETNEIIIQKYFLYDKGLNFLSSFKWSNLSIFNWNEKEKELLTDLINEKNALKKWLIKKAIKTWMFRFNADINEDILIIIDSGILDFFDKLYRYYEKCIPGMKNVDFGEELFYGIYEKDKVVSYKSILDLVDIKNLENIKNEYLRNYFLQIVNLIKNGNFDYKDWIESEKQEVADWLSDEQIVFITPMENYNHKNFIDPEFGLYLREKTQYKPEIFEKLSLEHFQDGYWMWKVNLYSVETLLESWEFSYRRYLGKSFPNDNELRKNYGNFILTIKWNYYKMFDEYNPKIAKIFHIDIEEILKNKELIINWVVEEVNYHEYWHSIFETQSTFIEELKATLFYWVYLYDKFITKWEELSINDIKSILYGFSLDFTIYISRLWKTQYEKYIFTAIVSFYLLQKNWLLNYNEEGNYIDLVLYDSNSILNFKNLLNDFYSITLEVKNIYETKNHEKEVEFRKFYEMKTTKIIWRLFENF